MKRAKPITPAWSGTALRVLSVASVTVGAASVVRALSRRAAEMGVSAAVDRYPPGLIRHRNSQSEQRQRADSAADRLRGLPSERLELTARDGTRLVGHWFPAAEPKRVILAFHGWRSSWARDFGPIAPFWAESGCSVLYAEQRGHGESGDDRIGFGFLERYDVQDWLAELERLGLIGDRPVYLAGISLGATTVMLAAGLPLPDCVHGVLADCGFTSAADIWKRVWERRQPLPFALWRRDVDRLTEARLGCLPDADSTPEALARTDKPVLLVHGLADDFVPPEMTERAYAACAAPKRLLLVPRAKHGMSYVVDPEGYQAALREFWESFD